MRLLERNPRLSGLMLGLAVLALAGVRAQAQLEVTSTRPGSIAIFPKVISDGTRDTIISLTNTTNMMAYVHCEATNGIGECAGSPDPANQTYYCNVDEDCLNVTDPNGSTVANAGPCEVRWQPGDYDLVLTAQQPTFWRVSTGRVQDPNLNSGDSCTTNGANQTLCPGFFLGNGNNGAGANIPGASGAFRGEIRCFQTDMSGSLSTGNALKGEAIIEALNTDGSGAGLLSAYNSLNVEGQGTPVSTDTANLNGSEYARCPDSLTIDHLAPGETDPISGADVEVELTFIPCTYNTINPTSMRVALNTYDQMEVPRSGGDIRTCWANYRGSEDGATANRDTLYLRTTAAAAQSGNCSAGVPDGSISCSSDSDCGRGGVCFDNACQGGSTIGRTCAVDANCGTGGVCGPPSGILGVAETLYDGGGIPGSSAEVAHLVGTRGDDDTMSTAGEF